MQIRISSPRHYESIYGSSDLVRAYLNQIEKRIGDALTTETIDILRISLLIAHPEELSQGKFLAYEKFDWKYGYVSIGINGNFDRYHSGDDCDKVREISEMLQAAFIQVGRKRKAKFSSDLANEIVSQITHAFIENHLRNK